MKKQDEIIKILGALGEYYDKPLTATQLAMYSEDLMDLEPSELTAAILTYRNDPRNTRFPLPPQLKAAIGTVLNPEDEAVQIVARILMAIGQIGPYRTEEAKAAIGEVGWRVVQAEGGWGAVCDVQTDDLPIRKAQWRNLAKSCFERRHHLPQSESKELEHVGDALKYLVQWDKKS